MKKLVILQLYYKNIKNRKKNSKMSHLPKKSAIIYTKWYYADRRVLNMQIYEIPRNYRGESRILYIFSTKALAYTGIGAIIGGLFYLIFNAIGLTVLGIIFVVLFGLIGFCIGTFKMPESKKFKLTEKTGGEAIDDVIKRWINFKRGKNKIYIYLKEDTKDE